MRLFFLSLLAVGLGDATRTERPPEPVQHQLTADADTTALYLLREGLGATTMGEPGGTAHLRGAAWVPGREHWAVAMAGGYLELPDAPENRPAAAITVEMWVKLAHVGG